MNKSIWVLGEALMDCIAQPDGTLKPLIGGSPYNLARAAALRGASVGYINPLSTDTFGDQMRALLAQDAVKTLLPVSAFPTSLAVVQIKNGQPSYGFYREGIADRDYTVDQIVTLLESAAPGVLHTGSLYLVPPESEKVVDIVKAAKKMGWIISIDVNLRPKLAGNLAKYVEAVKAVAQLADWLKASDEDLELLGFASPKRSQGAEIAKYFAEKGASRVALTFSDAGAWLQVDGQFAEQDVPQVAVVDTVGAGDTFWGNCLGDWVLNPQDAASRVQSTLSQAMQAAAINCIRAGCQPPKYSELV